MLTTFEGQLEMRPLRGSQPRLSSKFVCNRHTKRDVFNRRMLQAKQEMRVTVQVMQLLQSMQCPGAAKHAFNLLQTRQLRKQEARKYAAPGREEASFKSNLAAPLTSCSSAHPVIRPAGNLTNKLTCSGAAAPLNSDDCRQLDDYFTVATTIRCTPQSHKYIAVFQALFWHQFTAVQTQHIINHI
jgi:hypothetical protein